LADHDAVTAAVEIREADLSSYGPLVDLRLAREPRMRRQNAEFILANPSIWRFLHVRTAWIGDELAGWGLTSQPPTFPDDFALLQLYVRKDLERQGVGGALYRELLTTYPEKITRIGTAVSDDDPESLAVAQAHGFTLEQHAIESELELVDLPEPTPIVGVTYEDVSDLTFPDEDAVDAMIVDSQTNPEAVADGIVTRLASIRRTASSLAKVIAVLARVDGAPAAIIVGDIDEGILAIHYTGVGQAFRGRNLAFGLKQFAHRVAADAGATLSNTWNEEGNVGIRAVNRRLGYRVTGGVWRLSRPRP
jgi:GNAT superfamily N-acetyltransferase